MREHELDKLLLEKVKNQLDEGLEQLSPAIQARLQASRQQAVAMAGLRRFRSLVVPRWVTAGGLATAAVVAVATSLWFSEPRHPQKVKDVEEMEVLTVQGHLEMYDELEFYRWLADSRDRR